MRIDEFGSSAVYVDLEFGETWVEIITTPKVLILETISCYELYLSVTSTDELILDVRN